MYPYWECLSEPLLTRLQPRSIVEIGSEQGRTTSLLLTFCQNHDAVLYVIEPRPRYDVEACRRRFGDRFQFYHDLSLRALPKIDRYEAVIIDGDHNWYTVYHELLLMMHCCKETDSPFPLTLLHDVGWPYGRRDLYYDPSKIPPEHRQPFANKGILPGHRRQINQGGFNAGHNHAQDEGNPKNGVRTAVEDFLKICQFPLKAQYIPGFHGLGIIVDERTLNEKPELAEYLEQWRLPDPVARYIEQLEKVRIRLAMRT